MPKFRKPKTKYRAVFLAKDGNGFKEVDSLRLSDIGKKTFSYKKHSYQVKLENDLYTDKQGNVLLFYEFGKGSMLTFKEAKALMNSDELDEYIEQNIFGQLARVLRESLKGDSKSWIIPIAIGGILGGAIGYFVGMNYGAKTVVQTLNQTIPTAITFLRSFL